MKKFATFCALLILSIAPTNALRAAHYPGDDPHVWNTYKYQSDGTHTLLDVSYIDNVVELDDRSIWHLPPSAAKQTRDWKKGDQVIITPNQCIFTCGRYLYEIQNIRDDGSLKGFINTKPLRTPDLDGPFTYFLAGMKTGWSNARLRLEMNNDLKKEFDINPSDISKLRSWEEDHVIIIGKNKGSNSKYPLILINTCIKGTPFVTAKRL